MENDVPLRLVDRTEDAKVEMHLTTPVEIGESVYSLRDKIGVDTTPIFVSVRDTEGHKLSDCYFNVSRKIASDGGGIQHGWTVWEWPGNLIEGEFHAVWVSPDGSFVDITPKQDGETQILFIPDPNRTYEKIPIDNIRLVLTDDPEIQRAVRVNEEMARLRVKYNAGAGESEIPIKEALQAIQQFMPERISGSSANVGRNDPCPCGSGKKFKRCHGRVT